MHPKNPDSPRHTEWRTLALNPENDILLYRSLREHPETYGAFDRGTDLFAHAAPSGTVYFYLWHWSKRNGETCICQLTTEDSAVGFLREL